MHRAGDQYAPFAVFVVLNSDPPVYQFHQEIGVQRTVRLNDGNHSRTFVNDCNCGKLLT
jgi:hypothetical protein